MLRARYWKNHNLVDKVYSMVTGKPTGYTKLSRSMEDWDEYHADLENNHPYLNMFINAVGNAQDIVMYPLDKLHEARTYIRNRFIDRIHLIDTGLPKGKFHECETLMLHGMFAILVDFVEIQKAWSEVIWNEAPVPFWVNPRIKLLRWFKFRSRELGLKYLDWEISLGPNGGGMGQSDAARETKELYIWWKDIRPARVCAYKASGLEEWAKANTPAGKRFSFRNAKDPVWKELSDKMSSIEEQYAKEDQDMMYRLIEIRNSMWT